MEAQTLAAFTSRLVEERGEPRVLDVEHSVQVHKPTLSGTPSTASYYIRPPSGMSAEEFVEWFESIPGFADFRLTLVPIFGLDTYHQPMISSDDFARKHFSDNHIRIVRVVGKSNNAIQAMATVIEALKRPFDAEQFPHHGDFRVSGYKPAQEGRSAEVRLLFDVANPYLLMKVERLVSVHLDECNLGREIGVSRHVVRDLAPELILATTRSASFGGGYLDSLANSLPRATAQDVARATEIARSSAGPSTTVPASSAHFAQVQTPTRTLSPVELQRAVIAGLADLMRASRFGSGASVEIAQGGTTIEVKFARTASSLWLATSFNERKHIGELASDCVGVKANPLLREGWTALYSYESRTGTLSIRAVAQGSEPPDGWKAVRV